MMSVVVVLKFFKVSEMIVLLLGMIFCILNVCWNILLNGLRDWMMILVFVFKIKKFNIVLMVFEVIVVVGFFWMIKFIKVISVIRMVGWFKILIIKLRIVCIGCIFFKLC